jgi:hypothetical protein
MSRRLSLGDQGDSSTRLIVQQQNAQPGVVEFWNL